MCTLVGLCVAGVLLLAASGGFARTTAATWSGSRDTEWGPMKLTQSGTSVTGSYPHDTGRVAGTVSSARFRGRWNEAPTRKGPNDAGALEFTMTATGKKLVGRWTYDGSPTSWHTDWNGTCTAGACTRNTSAAGVSANFKLVRGTDKKEAITELRLVKGDFSVCPKRKPRGTEAGATAPTATVRQVWGQGTGSFRTKGRYASATVRGTFWLTADRCDGTFVRVRQGVIQVNDIPKRRVVTVPAPRTYLATP